MVDPRRHRLTDPGFDVVLTVVGDLDALYQVWEGRMEYGAAVRDRRLVVTGPTELVRALPRSLLLSPVAPYVRQAMARDPARDELAAAR